MVINPIVGVYIPIIRIPIKGGMTIPNVATFDHGTCCFLYFDASTRVISLSCNGPHVMSQKNTPSKHCVNFKIKIKRWRKPPLTNCCKHLSLFLPWHQCPMQLPSAAHLPTALWSQWPKSLPHWATRLPELTQSSSKKSSVLKVAHTWLFLIIIRLGSPISCEFRAFHHSMHRIR